MSDDEIEARLTRDEARARLHAWEIGESVDETFGFGEDGGAETLSRAEAKLAAALGVDLDAQHAPPFSSAEMRRWRRARQ